MEKTDDSSFQKHLELSLQPIESRVSLLESSLVKLSIGQSQQMIANQMVQNIENRLNTLETTLEKNCIYGDSISSSNLKTSLEKQHVNNALLDQLKQSKDDVAELLSVIDNSCKGNWEFEVAVNVLPIAVRCGSKGMIARLSGILEKALTVKVGVQMLQLASRLKLDSLLQASQRFIAENFGEVSETLDFRDLTFQELNVFVFSDTLRATEEHVFKAITCWVLKDRTNRSALMSVLITALRLPSCSLKFLQEMRTHFLLNDHNETQSSIDKEISTRSSVSLDSQEHDKEIWRWTKPQDTLFIMGGSGADSSFETFDVTTQSWVLHKDTIHPDGTTFVVSTRHVIIVLEVVNKRMRSFNPVSKEWKDLRPLPVFRNGMCVSLEDTGLYVMGGDGHGGRCDVYSIHLDSWAEITGLKTARSYASSAPLKGKIYCSGGMNSTGNALSSVELYDPKNKLWSSAKSLIAPEYKHCLVPCSKYLWTFGGCYTSYSGLARYDPSVDTWTKMAQMITDRYNGTGCYYGGLLYVIGGGKPETPITSTDVYDPLENKWTKSAPLHKGRTFAGCCVIQNLVNAEEYKVPLQ